MPSLCCCSMEQCSLYYMRVNIAYKTEALSTCALNIDMWSTKYQVNYHSTFVIYDICILSCVFHIFHEVNCVC